MSTEAEGQRQLLTHRIQAIDDATSALASGIRMSAVPGWQARRGQSALQVIASGVEKLANITLAMMGENETGKF